MAPSEPPGIVWSWPSAWRGLPCAALPGALVASGNVAGGLGLAFGAVLSGIVGLAPQRRDRWRTLVVVAVAALSMTVGSVLQRNAAVAVAGIFVLAVVACWLAARRPVGVLALSLCVPLVGAGLSFDGPADALGMGLAMMGGACWALGINLLWPDQPAGPRRPMPLMERDAASRYGVRLGLVGAVCAWIGFAHHWDHPGWATAVGLMVSRPTQRLQHQRAVARAVAVAIGALLGAFVVGTGQTWLIATAAALVVAGATATHGSRWYITGGFTTFITIALLASSVPRSGAGRVNERIGETLLGIAVAMAFEWLDHWTARRGQPEASPWAAPQATAGPAAPSD